MTTPVAIENGLFKAITGYNVMANIRHRFAGILEGEHDQEILCAFFHTKYQEGPKTQEQLQEPELANSLLVFKANVQASFDQAAKEIQEFISQRDKHTVESNFKNMSKPAPEGTVANIATQYNVSISYVRKLKREGRLAELTNP